MASLGDQFRNMVAKDPQKVLLRRALRMALMVPLLFWFMIYVLNMPKASVPAVFALFCVVAFADFGGPLLHRFRANLVLTVVGALLILFGVLCGTNIWIALPATFVVCFAIAFSAILRGYFAASTIALLVPWVMAVTGQAPDTTAVPQAIAWCIGGLAGAIACLVLWPARIMSPLRLQVAATLDSAGKTVAQTYLDEPGDSEPEMAANRQKLHQFFYGRPTRPGPGTSRDRNLLQTIDQTFRLVTVLEWDKTHPHPDEATGTKELATQTAQTLSQSSQAIANSDSSQVPDPAELNAAREVQAQQTLGWVEQQAAAGNTTSLRDSLRSAFGVRMAAMSTQITSYYVRGAVGVHGRRNQPDTAVTLDGENVVDPRKSHGIWRYLTTHLSLSSPWTRNALRTAIALTLSVLVVYLTKVEHGFWVSLGVIVALRFDTTGTLRTGKQMVIGTIVGYALGVAVLLLGGSHSWVYWTLLPIAVFIAIYAPGTTTMTIGQGAFTFLLVVMFGVMMPGSIQASAYRFPDVVLGIIVALVTAALMWPRGVAPMVARTLQESAAAAAKYLQAAVHQTVGTPSDGEQPNQQEALASISVADETFEVAMAQMIPGLGDIRTWAAISNTNQHLVRVGDVITKLPQTGELPKANDTLQDVLTLTDTLPSIMTEATTKLTEEADQSKAAELFVDADIDTDDDPAVQQLESSLSRHLEQLSPADDIPATVGLSVLCDWVIQSHWVVTRLQKMANQSTADQTPAS